MLVNFNTIKTINYANATVINKNKYNKSSLNTSFRGYDARPLSGILLRDGFLADEKFLDLVYNLAEILNQEGVDVFTQDVYKINKNNFKRGEIVPTAYFPYVQDTVTFMPNNEIITEPLAEYHVRDFNSVLKNYFNRPLIEMKNHLPGGNFFFVKEGDTDAVILGNAFVSHFNAQDRQKVFDDRKVYNVPQPDYHIDLSMRPLNNRRILVHDPQLLLEKINKAIQNANSVYSKTNDEKVKSVMLKLKEIYEKTKKAQQQHNMSERCNALTQALKNYQFDIIRVPAAVQRPSSKSKQLYSKTIEVDCNNERIRYDLNYMNAVVHERADGSLVYITNKSNLDKKVGITPEIATKIRFSFEKMFTDSLKGIIKTDDIHFVGVYDNFLHWLLSKKLAGLHCLISEIPKL